MYSKTAVVALALAGSAMGQRPTNTSICDYYTTALLKNNTAENQYTLLTLLVNTVVIGNYTMPNVGVAVPGILAPGMYNGMNVNLVPYFNGQLASSNRGGSSGVGINFLDGGGAVPIMKNMPANDNKSNQYFLLTHLYQFFGALVGCSKMGPNAMSAFSSYTGQSSMYSVHKFMDLSPAEVGYFITQVGLAAASFGVAKDDITVVANALTSLFDMRCSPPTEVIPGTGAQLQAICIQDTCPIASGAACASYAAAVLPMNATSTMSGASSATMTMSSGSSTMTGTGTAASGSTATSSGTASKTSTTTVVTAGAAVKGASLLAAAGGIAVLLL